MQFKAGYIIDSIAKIINDSNAKLDKNKPSDQLELDQINGLLQYVSSFDVDFSYNKHLPDFKNLNPVLATLNNIITRGLPTRAPIILEKLFTEIGLTEKTNEEFEINFPSLTTPISYEDVFELLHIIEPQLEISKANYGGNLGSNLEWGFIKNHPFVKQILESQRDFSKINSKLSGGKTVDFCFTSPYVLWNDNNNRYEKVGRIFEIDGSLHSLSEYKYYDDYRDAIAEDENFETIRFTVETIKEDKTDFEVLIGRKVYQKFKNNFEKNIKEHLAEYSLIFIPIAVARVQKTILEFFLVHPEFFKKEKIEIAIIERDLPCGAIAIKSLQEMFFNINAILDDSDKLLLPEISAIVFENSKWVIDHKLHLQARIEDESFFNHNEFDIVLDHSVLRRSNIYKETDFQNDKSIKIRSSHFFDTAFGNSRRVYCANLLNYKSLVEKKDDGSYIPVYEYESHINFFIQNIFRKISFLEGQLPIISRALQQKPVIGLLPTGGGKSLTFQLPAFLQPGLCLVVDPIKSLMEDQVRVLKLNWIDCCEFINSNLKREEKVKKLIDFRYGETMFLFVSPERFVMKDFRNIIQTIDVSSFGLAFSYCVIDEVHCVSEWGHDFRSTYLMLGKNSQLFCSVRNSDFEKRKTDPDEKRVSLIGLTATASFDVLADIERELQIQHHDIADAIIMIENTIRPELFFRVIDVTGKDRMCILNEAFSDLSINLQKINKTEILEKSQEHHFLEFEKRDFATKETFTIKDESKIVFEYNPKYLIEVQLIGKNQNDFSAIVFCPVKGEKKDHMGDFFNKQGVRFVHSNLNSNSKGFFFASDDDSINDEVHKHFIDFISYKKNHIVCTKAFGMGIDKKDIRSTYHFIYSSSLESLVQEAGRSGRDKKISEANILVSRERVFRFDGKCLFQTNPIDSTPNIIKDVYHRKKLRKLLQQDFLKHDEAVAELTSVVNELKIWKGGTQIPIATDDKELLIARIKDFITESFFDRDIHNYFFKGNFKGKDIEYSQIYSLFNDREFEISDKLIELNEEYNQQFGKSFVFKYWSTKHLKRLYVSDIEETEYGFIDLAMPLIKHTTFDFEHILSFFKSRNNGNDDIFKLISEKVITELNEGTLKEIFEANENINFPFIITSEKIFPNNNEAILSKLSQIPGQIETQNSLKNKVKSEFEKQISFDKICTEQNDFVTVLWNWFSVKKGSDVLIELKESYINEDFDKFIKIVYLTQIEKSRKQSTGYIDFLLLLEENIKKLQFTFNPQKSIERWLKLYYYRSRYFKPTNDTGRLIYRMHSMGFLEDYIIDYNKNNLYSCTFKKFKTIDEYIKAIEKYLRRYLSENTAMENIEALKSRLVKPTLVEKIIECLYFLSEFSYKEIASKRKRATDEIESVLNTSITEPSYVVNWFQQNLYIKEQIYFYFNAKYARIGYKINGQAFSLLDDYRNLKITKPEILNKYTEVLKEGTEQNNYKHMMGSCKKILRSLSETDLNNEWLLRLLKAFSMYSVNNASYISEANAELELGFDNLYNQKNLNEGKLESIKPIFDSYFERLVKNIQPDNPSFNDIKMIRLKILLKMQTGGINDLLENIKLT